MGNAFEVLSIEQQHGSERPDPVRPLRKVALSN